MNINKKYFLSFFSLWVLFCFGVLEASTLSEGAVVQALFPPNTYQGQSITPQTLPGMLPPMPEELGSRLAQWRNENPKNEELLTTLTECSEINFDAQPFQAFRAIRPADYEKPHDNIEKIKEDLSLAWVWVTAGGDQVDDVKTTPEIKALGRVLIEWGRQWDSQNVRNQQALIAAGFHPDLCELDDNYVLRTQHFTLAISGRFNRIFSRLGQHAADLFLVDQNQWVVEQRFHLFSIGYKVW